MGMESASNTETQRVSQSQLHPGTPGWTPQKKTGFDHDRYTKLQSERILERISEFGGKLYLELGGKLFDDYHASRVLPGFLPDSKIAMLLKIKEQCELIIAISADDIEKSKIRGDLGITYDADVFRLIDAFRGVGMLVTGVVLTKYAEQKSAEVFMKRLIERGVRVWKHYPIEGYPYDVEHIVSPEGYGKNEFIETTRPLVLVTAPGPGSGKMAVCLSQLYQENMRGNRAGYAKFETFPIWNLPLTHPVNMAYEAATADIADVNMIDPFHLEAYGTTTVNYNRDIEIFPVLSALFMQIMGRSPYRSPTDMGVNMVGYCIVDDQVCRDASAQEIIRRFYTARCRHLQGTASLQEIEKIRLLMHKLNLSDESRPVIGAARGRAQETGAPVMAIALDDSTIITGKTSDLLGPSAAAVLNAIKKLAGIEKSVHLIPPEIIAPIQELKCTYLGNHNPRLHTDEVLQALSISAVNDENAAKAMKALPLLNELEAHSTVILPHVDDDIYRRLGIRVTQDPQYQVKKLYHK